MSDQSKGQKIAQNAVKNNTQMDLNKVNANVRDAALAEQKRLTNKG